MHPPTLNALNTVILLSALTQPLAFATESKNIFVDPINGNPKGEAGVDGSIDSPFKSINGALEYAESNYNRGSERFPYTIQLREGTYTETVTKIGIKGAPDRPITVQSYQNEKVLFDGSIDISNVGTKG